MGLTRVSEDGIQKRREQISRLKDEIRQHEEVVGQKDSPLWKRIGPMIQDSIKANREKLEVLLAAGPTRDDGQGNVTAVDPIADLAAAKLLVGAITFGKSILGEVEVEATIEKKRARVQTITEELKKIEQEQGI